MLFASFPHRSAPFDGCNFNVMCKTENATAHVHHYRPTHLQIQALRASTSRHYCRERQNSTCIQFNTLITYIVKPARARRVHFTGLSLPCLDVKTPSCRSCRQMSHQRPHHRRVPDKPTGLLALANTSRRKSGAHDSAMPTYHHT